MQVTDAMVAKAAEVAYLRNRAGDTPWDALSPQHQSEWREKVRPVVTAALAEMCRAKSMAAQWTYDPEAEAYYFAPLQAAPPPYLRQRHVEAIIDIASDGTLAGVELIDNMPPPPLPAPPMEKR